MLQGEKFDAKGEYIRRWCPELAQLPDDVVHRPFEARANVLESARVTLGDNYPLPVVDHGKARDRALAALKAIRAEADD